MKEGFSEEELNKNENLDFYYNREERIKNAPKIVRDYYAGKMNAPRGLFKVLVANRFNRFMFLSVVIFAAVAFLTNLFSSRGSLAVCAGFECELSAVSNADTVFAKVSIHPLKKSLADKNFALDEYIAEGRTASGLFSFIDDNEQVNSSLAESAVLQKNEFFLRTNSPDYDIIEVIAQIEILGERAELKAKVKKM